MGVRNVSTFSSLRGVLSQLAFAMVLTAGPVGADHPDPLPDSITTTNFNYFIEFTDDNVYNPDTDADPACDVFGPGDVPIGADANFFPAAQALRVADAYENSSAFSVGTPNGHHPGFTALNFLMDDWRSPTSIFDCSVHTYFGKSGCDNGQAPRDLVRLPSTVWICRSDASLRLVVGHELFHHVQYAYEMGSVGNTIMEGTARMMQDQIYSDLDGDAGSMATFRNEISAYMSVNLGATPEPDNGPNQSIWEASYQAALWWKYLSEQYGTINVEPNTGTDFIRTLFENAQAISDTPNAIETVRDTIKDYDVNGVLEEVYLDYSIANIAKEFDVSGLPNASRYAYIDESDGVSGSYANAPRTWSGTFPPNLASVADNVSKWGSKYYEGALGSCGEAIVGFRSEGDWAAYGLMAVRGDGSVANLFRGRTDDFAVALILDGADPIDRLVAVVTGMQDDANFEYSFACGQATLEILRPTSNFAAYVGESSDPERFLIRLVVSGPPELGIPTVKGLDPSYFSVYVGAVDPANQATVISGAEVQGEYWLVAQAPTKPANGTFDLTVELKDVASDTKNASVLYEVKVLDELLVLDRSGSMLSPLSFPKIDAATGAASLFVDAAGSDGQIGVVSFGGDNVESNDDATLEQALATVTDGQRTAARAAIAGISIPDGSVLTSIGDGLEKARLEYAANGTALGQDVLVLLSDGMENEALFASDVLPDLLSDGIEVHSIALGSGANQALLQQLATATGGTFYYVDVGSLGSSLFTGIPANAHFANRLSDAFVAAFEASNDLERLWEVAATLIKPATNHHSIVLVENGVEDARWSFHWANPGDALAVTIEKDGTALVDGIDGVRIYTDSDHVEIHKAMLAPGTYVVTAQATTGNPEYVGILSARVKHGVNLAVYLGQVIDSSVKAAGGTFAWGAPMPLVASLTEGNGPLANASVVGEITHPDGSVISLPLFDDGNHGDGAAGNGIYANVYARTTQASPTGLPDDPATPGSVGSYNVSVSASGTSNLGESFSRIRKLSFHALEDQESASDRDLDGMPDVYEIGHDCLDENKAEAGLDPDEDDLANLTEWREGTNPCNQDTDGGGENDSSEFTRASNPFDPEDDVLPRPLDVEVISRVSEHLTDAFVLLPGVNTIRYPGSPAYDSIRIFRSTSPTGPFTLLSEITPDASAIFRDETGTVGQIYYYQVQATGSSGTTSARSPVFSGTPKTDPHAPIGGVVIADGASEVESNLVSLRLRVDDNDATEMRIRNAGDPTIASWQTLASTVPWTLAPDPATGRATVLAEFRDATGNLSFTYTSSVIVRAPGSLGSISGSVVLTGVAAPPDPGGHVMVSVDAANATPVFVDSDGNFTLTGLGAGTYEVTLSYSNAAPIVVPNVVVTAGGTTQLAQETLVVESLSSLAPLAIVALAALLMFTAIPMVSMMSRRLR